MEKEPLPGDSFLETTMALLERAKAGDRQALEALCSRYRVRLSRWAAGRLPTWARDGLDTDDLVQEALMKTIAQIGRFEPRHAGSLQAYLRQAIHNRIQDEVRRAHRRPRRTDLDPQQADLAPSPLEKTVGRDALRRYEEALGKLEEQARLAIVMRFELESTYEEVAQALGKPSPDAARMMITRALVRLAKEMGHES